jgi:hypothetical protein
MLNRLEKSVEKLTEAVPESSRDIYLQYVNRVLEKALYKYEHRQTKNRERIAWGRLIVQAVSTGNAVLKDQELETLAERLTAVESKLS